MLKNYYSPAKLDNNIHVIFLFLLGCRLTFIFSNAAKSPSLPETSTIPQMAQEITLSTTSRENASGIVNEPIQEPSQQIIGNVQNKVSLTEDIGILELAYQKDKDMKIVKTLIEKLAQNYEFEKANKYLQELIINPDYDQSIAATLHLYIAIHDPTIVSITDAQSIQKIIPIMDEYKNAGRLNADDYNFYQGLIKIRYKDYK